MVASPRGSELDAEERRKEKIERDVEALSSGPIVVMVVEKDDAVNTLAKLVGPDEAELWKAPEHSATLRAQYAQSSAALGFRSSLNAWAVEAEREFFFSETIRRDLQSDPSTFRAKKSDKVAMSVLLKFLFPPQLQHPKSTGRLYVFALYGPLDEKSRLRSGDKGQHVLNGIELDTMCLNIEREDILSVYADGALTAAEEEEIMKQADHYLKVIPQFTKEDIQRIINPLSRDSQGLLSFHEMQKLIFQVRQDRVAKMKAKIEIKLKDELQAKLKAHRTRRLPIGYDIAPPSMFRKNEGLNGSQNAVVVSKLLNTNAFKICTPQNSNKPEITQNVRLLREEYQLEDTPNRPDWK